MNNLTVFNNEEFGNLRSLEINGEPWFAGKDVAEALGYSNTKDAIITHIDEEDKRIIQRSEITTIENHLPKSAFPVNFVSAEIPARGLTFINESGLYSLIMRSKLPNAKKFKRWVTSEVLPSLRKTGSYSLSNAQDLSQNTQLVIAIGNSLAEQERRINQMETKVDGAVEVLKTAVKTFKVDANWRSDIVENVRNLIKIKGLDYREGWNSYYRELEKRAHCKLKARLNNRIRNMKINGESKTKIDNVRILDIVESVPVFKEIFSKIVGEDMIIYGLTKEV